MAKLLDCEPVGSREVIDPSLVVAVTLDDNVTLSEGGTTAPALAGTWSTITNQYVTGIQFEYGPSDLSSGITLTTANKAALSWVHGAGLLPVKSYTIRYRAIGAAPNTFGPWAGPFTRTSGTGVASDVSPSSPTNLANLDRLLDEALARFEADLAEETNREIAVTDTQRYIRAIGEIDPASQTVDMRNTARNVRIGGLYLDEMDVRVDEGLSPEGQIQQPIPYEVSRVSGVANDQIDILHDGTIVRDGVAGGQVVRVLEAEGFLGAGAFIRRDPADGNLGGRFFLEKPLINTTLTGNVAVDIYQSLIRIFDANNLYGVTLPVSAFQPSIGGRIVVSTAAGVVAGDVASTTALRAPYARIGNAFGIGYITLEQGDATYSGRAEFFNAAGGRLGFIGLGTSTTLLLSAETGKNWATDKRFDMLAGAAVTGALTVSGLATLSGGAAVTGDITTTAALHAGGFVRVRAGSGGYVQHTPGDATYTGYTEYYNAAGTRLGYTGLGSGGTLVMAAEGAVTWAFDKQLRMLAGADVTGALAVSGLSSLSGGAAVTGNLTVSSGFVGIRTSASTTIPLKVQAPAVADWTAYFIGSANTGLSYGPLIDAGTNASDYNLYCRNIGGTELFSIRGDGRATFKGEADHRGTVYFNNGAAGLLSWTTGYSDGTTLVFDGPSGGGCAIRPNGGTVALFAKSNGKIGIGGITNPTEALHVNGRAMVTSSGYTANPVGGVLGYYSSTVPQTYIQAPSGGEVVVWDGPTNQLAVFRADGKFGLGIAAPLDRAHIHGGGLVVSGSSETITGPTSFTSLTGKMLQASYDATNNKAVIRSVYWGSSFTPLYFQGGEFRWATGSGSVTERMVLDGSGNLGLGLGLGAAPGVRLDVSVGDVYRGARVSTATGGVIEMGLLGQSTIGLQSLTNASGFQTLNLNPNGGNVRIGGSLVRIGADHRFAVDSGFGFYFDHNGTPCGLLEGNGRLSINALNIGGNPVGVTTNYAPTLGSETGGVTSTTVENPAHVRVGTKLTVTATYAVSALAGPNGNYATITLPFTAAKYSTGHGFNFTQGVGLTVSIAAGATVAQVRKTANGFPFAAGDSFNVTFDIIV